MGFLTGSPINPVTAPFTAPEMLQAFSNWLGGMLTPNAAGGGFSMSGPTQFNPNSEFATNARQNLTVPINQTLRNAFAAWSPTNAGTDALATILGMAPNPDVMGDASNMRQYGTIGGFPGEVAHSIVQYGGFGDPAMAMKTMMQQGGVGGRGLPGMAAAQEYGAPSNPAGRYAANTAQFGISDETAGRPLVNRAYGQTTAATNFLAPFLAAQSRPQYRAPNINQRAVTRI